MKKSSAHPGDTDQDVSLRLRASVAKFSLQLFFALIVKPFVALFVGLRVFGREHLPAAGPFILIANHSSHMDTVCLMSLFPVRQIGRVRPCAASDYFLANPAVAFLSRAFFNILPIPRKNITAAHNPLSIMGAALERKEGLILFPEGTRGGGERMGEFKSGIAHLVEKYPDVPIIPAYLVNMGRCLPKGHYIPAPFFAEIHIGPAAHPRGTRQEILESLERSVLELGNNSIYLRHVRS